MFKLYAKLKANPIASSVLAYFLIAIFTFGHCFSTWESNMHNDAFIKSLGSGISAAFWPLYWSVQIQ